MENSLNPMTVVDDKIVDPLMSGNHDWGGQEVEDLDDPNFDWMKYYNDNFK